MKNVKIILTALAVALSSCNIAHAMNMQGLLEKVSSNLPSWQPTPAGNLELKQFSPGAIQEAIEKLESELGQTSDIHNTPSLITKAWNTISNQPTNLAQEYNAAQHDYADIAKKNIGYYNRNPKSFAEALHNLPNNPIIQEKLATAQVLQDEIMNTGRSISCLEELKVNYQDLHKFAQEHQDSLKCLANSGIRNPDEVELAQQFVKLLQNPNKEFAQCMNNVQGVNATDYQHLIVDTTSEIETLKNVIALAQQDVTKYENLHQAVLAKMREHAKLGGFTQNDPLLNDYLKLVDQTRFNTNCADKASATCHEFLQQETENLKDLNKTLSNRLEYLTRFAEDEKGILEGYIYPGLENHVYPWTAWGKEKTADGLTWCKSTFDSLYNWGNETKGDAWNWYNATKEEYSPIAQQYWNHYQAYVPHTCSLAALFIGYRIYKKVYPESGFRDYIQMLITTASLTALGTGAVAAATMYATA